MLFLYCLGLRIDPLLNDEVGEMTIWLIFKIVMITKIVLYTQQWPTLEGLIIIKRIQ